MWNEIESEETIKPDVVSSYIPDFSDISDENSEFWDFLKTNENIKSKPREKNRSSDKTQLSDFPIYPCKNQSEVILQESPNDLYLNDSGISLDDERKKLSNISENEFCLEACEKSESFGVNNDKPKLKKFEEADDEFWKFLGTSTKTCTEYELSHTRKKKSNISKTSPNSEDKFWDFLKIDSPETENVISFQEFLARNNTHTNKVTDVNVLPSQGSVANDLNLKIQSSYTDSGRANSLSDSTLLSTDTGSISPENMKIPNSNKESLYHSGIKLRELSEHHFNKNSTKEGIFSLQAKTVGNVENTSLTSEAIISYPEMHDMWREEREKKHSLEQELRTVLPTTKLPQDVASEVQTIKTTSSFEKSDFVEKMKLSRTSSTNNSSALNTTSQVLNAKEYQCSNSSFTVSSNNLSAENDERILTGISASLQSPFTELLSKENYENANARDNLPRISSVLSIPSYLDWAESFNQTCEVPKLGHLTELESQNNLCLRGADKIHLSPKHSTYFKECKKRRLSSSPIGCSQFKISDSPGREFEKTCVEIQTSSEKKQKLNLDQMTALNSNIKTLPEQALPCISKCYLSNSTQSTKGNIFPEPKSANSTITLNQNNSLPLYLILPQSANGQSSNVTHLFMILQNNNSDTGTAINVSNQISQTTDGLKRAETGAQNFVQNNQQLTDHRFTSDTQLNVHPVSNGQFTSSSKCLPEKMIYTTAEQPINFQAINSDSIRTVSNSAFHEPYKSEGVLPNLKMNSNITFKTTVSNKSEDQIKPLLPLNITALHSQSHIMKQNSTGQNTSQRKFVHPSMLIPNSRNLDKSKFHAILKSSTENETLSKNKLSNSKAIKTITIGKDNHAIQQTSIPLKMGSIDHKLQEDVSLSIANYLQLSSLDESTMRTGKTVSEKQNNQHDDIMKGLINETEIDYGRTSQPLINSEYDSQHTDSVKCEVYTSLIPNNISQTEQEMNGKEATELLTVKSVGNSIQLRSDTNLFVSASQPDCNSGQNETKQQKNTHYIMPKIVPIHFQVTRAVTEVSTMNTRLTQTNAVITLPEKINTIASIPAFGELVPTSASVISVSAVQPSQTGNKPVVSKVLVLPRTSKQKICTQMSNSKQPGQHVTYSKKAVPKKVGRKTVRELLEERNLISSNKMGSKDEMLNNKIGVKVLKPILRLTPSNVLTTVLPQIVSGYVGNALEPTKINEGNDLASNSSQSSNTQGKPNILMLPSASKSTKNCSEKINEIQLGRNKDLKSTERNISNIFPSERCSYGLYEKDVGHNLFSSDKRDFTVIYYDDSYKIAGATVINTQSSILLPPFKNGIVNGKEHRPRHYDMSLLLIGSFKVEDDVDSAGRFRSKFKVLFTKRQFLYDFPVSKCNKAEWTSSPMWEQMARIVVPFQSVTYLDLDNRTINLSVCTAPLIFLGRIEARSGIISNATVYNILLEKDSAWGEGIRSSWNHKVVLRKQQASKLKTYLCQFDQRFLILTNLNAYTPSFMNEASFSEQQLTSDNFHRTLNRYKKTMIRRLPQWDFADREGKREANEEGSLLNFNQMCSCRISCRSVRCSCVKAAKSCSEGRAVCLCINCDNPLNILESIGMNLEFSLSDSCLFQNIYQIPKLSDYLKRVIKLSCCNSVARVQDVIPGTVLCPNVDCNERLEFSWCRGIVCCPERNPRNHCSYCGLCCFSNGRHCLTCNRCYTVTPKCPKCPTCRDKVIPDKSSTNNDSTQRSVGTRNQISKRSSKPEIILLDASLSSKSNVSSEDVMESDRFPPAFFEKKNEKTTKINSNHETNSNDERPVEIKITREGLFTMTDTEKREGQSSVECFPVTTEAGEPIAKDAQAFQNSSNGNEINKSKEANIKTCSSVELPEIEIISEVPFIKIQNYEGNTFTEYFSSVMNVDVVAAKTEKTFELLQEVSSKNEIAPKHEENVNTVSNDELPLKNELSSAASLIRANTEKCKDQSCLDYFSTAEETHNVMGNNDRTLQTSNSNEINTEREKTVNICCTAELFPECDIPSKALLSMACKEKNEDRSCTEYPLTTTATDSAISESERTFQSLQESLCEDEMNKNYEAPVKLDSDELRSIKNDISCKMQSQADTEKCANNSFMEYPSTVANDKVTTKSERTFQSFQKTSCKTKINKTHEASVKLNLSDESPTRNEMSNKVPFKADADKCGDNLNYTQYFSTLIEVNGVIVKNEKTFEIFPQTSKINS